MYETGSITPLSITTPLSDRTIEGELTLPSRPFGVVVIAHNHGSGFNSPRYRYVARLLRERGFGTLIIDGLCAHANSGPCDDVSIGAPTEEIAERIEAAGEWLQIERSTTGLPVGYLGTGIAGSAALLAAAMQPGLVQAVVTHSACTEGIASQLPMVEAATLMIVGSRDLPLLSANREALLRLCANEKWLEVVPGADHTFEEPGALAAVALHSANWLARWLSATNLTFDEPRIDEDRYVASFAQPRVVTSMRT